MPPHSRQPDDEQGGALGAPGAGASAVNGPSIGAAFKVDKSSLQDLHNMWRTLIKDVKEFNAELGKTSRAGAGLGAAGGRGGMGAGGGHGSGGQRMSGMPDPPDNFNSHVSSRAGGGRTHAGGGMGGGGGGFGAGFRRGGGFGGGFGGGASLATRVGVTAGAVMSNLGNYGTSQIGTWVDQSEMYRRSQIATGGSQTAARQWLFGSGPNHPSAVGAFGSYQNLQTMYGAATQTYGPGIGPGTPGGRGLQAAGQVMNLTGDPTQGGAVQNTLARPQTFYAMQMIGVNMSQLKTDPQGFARTILTRLYRGVMPTAAKINRDMQPGAPLRRSMENLGLDEATINFVAQFGLSQAQATAAGKGNINLAPTGRGGLPSETAANKAGHVGTNAAAQYRAAQTNLTGANATVGAHTPLAGMFAAVANAGSVLLGALQGFIGALAGGATGAGMGFNAGRSLLGLFGGGGGLLGSLFGGGGGGGGGIDPTGGGGGGGGLGFGGGGGGGGGLLGGLTTLLLGRALFRGGRGLLGGLGDLLSRGGSGLGGLLGRAGRSVGGLFARGGAAAGGFGFDPADPTGRTLIPQAGRGLLGRLLGAGTEGGLGRVLPVVGAGIMAAQSGANTYSAINDAAHGRWGDAFKTLGHDPTLNTITFGMAGHVTNSINELTQGHYKKAAEDLPLVGPLVKLFAGDVHGKILPPPGKPNFTGVYNGWYFHNGKPVYQPGGPGGIMGGEGLGGNAVTSSVTSSLAAAGLATGVSAALGNRFAGGVVSSLSRQQQGRNPMKPASGGPDKKKQSMKTVYPVAGATVTQKFGQGGHPGTDFAAPCGTPIMAVEDGNVIASGPAQGFGNWIVIMHPDGYASVYGHMKSADLLVHVGQAVRGGQVIARVGSEGYSTGCHCHLEIHNGWPGTRVDPETWLKGHGAASVASQDPGGSGAAAQSSSTSSSSARTSAAINPPSNYGSHEEKDVLSSALSMISSGGWSPGSSASNTTQSASSASGDPSGIGSSITPTGSWASHLPAAGKQYAGLIQAAAHATGVNPAMIAAVAQHESAFINGLQSSDGYNSWGLMQFIPSTGKAFGLNSQADHNNPAKDLLAGGKYLKTLLGQSHGNVYAAYRGYASGDVNSQYADANARARELTSIFNSYGNGPGLGNYAKGAWEVEHDQIAVVHEDEMIVPKRPADRLRAAVRQQQQRRSMPAAGGGNTSSISAPVTVHLTAPVTMATGNISDVQRHVDAVVKTLQQDERLANLITDAAGAAS